MSSSTIFGEPDFENMASIVASWNAHAYQFHKPLRAFTTPAGQENPIAQCALVCSRKPDWQSTCTANKAQPQVKQQWGAGDTYQEVDIQSLGRIVVSGLFSAAQRSGRPPLHTGSPDIVGRVPQCCCGDHALDPAHFLHSLPQNSRARPAKPSADLTGGPSL